MMWLTMRISELVREKSALFHSVLASLSAVGSLYALVDLHTHMPLGSAGGAFRP